MRRVVGVIAAQLGSGTSLERSHHPVASVGHQGGVGIDLLQSALFFEDFLDTHPGEISSGTKQRVGIARARCMKPQVLLMDEPFGALDTLTRAKLQDELLQIVTTTHSTVVMVTHDVDEAVLLSDRIVMMTNGPAATIGEVLHVALPRPRSRVQLADDSRYLGYRKAVIDFLYTRQVHVEKLSA